jgi:predicted nucleic acid-binding protein
VIPGGLYLADTSAIARVANPAIHPAIHRELTRLGRLGLLAACVTVDLEVLYSARTPAEQATTAARRATGFIDRVLLHSRAWRHCRVMFVRTISDVW